MITTQTELDVSPGGIAPVIHVSQYDTGSPRSEARSRTGMASPMNARSVGKPSLLT